MKCSPIRPDYRIEGERCPIKHSYKIEQKHCQIRPGSRAGGGVAQ